ncbi:hypothetical protein GJ496_001615 [Pomphorhynchus laevis]|nr:hypothetical protein GJ496_001615 [Pomphorhynchus laevis]
MECSENSSTYLPADYDIDLETFIRHIGIRLPPLTKQSTTVKKGCSCKVIDNSLKFNYDALSTPSLLNKVKTEPIRISSHLPSPLVNISKTDVPPQLNSMIEIFHFSSKAFKLEFKAKLHSESIQNQLNKLPTLTRSGERSTQQQNNNHSNNFQSILKISNLRTNDFQRQLRLTNDMVETKSDIIEQPSLCSLLEAFTLRRAADGINLERFELYGDAYLKLIVTCSLILQYPQANEGQLSMARSKLTSNKHLYQLAVQHGIQNFIVGRPFDPYSQWVPPLYSIKKSAYDPAAKDSAEFKGTDIWMNDNKDSHIRDLLKKYPELSDHDSAFNNVYTRYKMLCGIEIPKKAVADVVEALIGCYLSNNNEASALHFMQWIGIHIVSNYIDSSYH